MTFTGRRRHRHNNMMPLLALGATAFGIVTVPMGLQILMIICGKAVLLSKMALLISSINGSGTVFSIFLVKERNEDDEKFIVKI